MDRRKFVTAVGAAVGSSLIASERAGAESAPQMLRLSRNGWMPNNEEFPVLLYRRAFAMSEDMASAMEAAFARNGCRMTGMRLWMGSINSLASLVTIEKVSSGG
jgi:hypothetical protein